MATTSSSCARAIVEQVLGHLQSVVFTVVPTRPIKILKNGKGLKAICTTPVPWSIPWL